MESVVINNRILMVETGGWGGIGHYGHCICEALQEQGATVRLVTHANNYQLQSFAKSYSVNQCFVGDGFLADWRRLRQAWHGERVIHFQSLLSTRRDWLAFHAFKRMMPGARWVVTVHNVLPHEVARGEPWAYRRLYRAADGLIVHSHATKLRLIKLMGGDFDKPVAVIPHGHYGEITGVDLPSRGEAMATLKLDPAHRYLVCFGAIRPYKGIDMLLWAAARIAEWPEDVKVLVIGHLLTGVSEEELVSLRSELGLEDRVVFKFGYVAEEHIPHVFAATDLSLLPYRNIDQSGVLMAALAAGAPVLCTPVGAFPEVVEMAFGFLARDVSIKGVAAALENAFAVRDQWPSMGAAAKAAAEEKYGWDRIAGQTLEFYEQLARRGAPAT